MTLTPQHASSSLAAELDPKSPEALAGVANVAMKQKRYPEAEAALRKLLVADPQNNSARYQLARVLAEEGKNEEAADELKKGLQAGGNPEAELQLGSLYVNNGNDGEAEHWLRQAAVGFDNVLKACGNRHDCSPQRDLSQDLAEDAQRPTTRSVPC